ncbi:uncharacterized protein PITG_08891 [Phytophthora infestans T30-4]|uniref:Uncharacterized protein n=1 Tax=Phytophthora infestans (strain T30-4) TaxID=403677 RepID=D0NDF6_PHYIT|nr:uncharacterized protein PITG_08891 [Phytophthora infestans T30-4]EEY56113.1 hypothetical protein PITG_08891 [Phytophthora infestans T30-4]|eukprot:XP_002902943.1 hypothetical protein PITG_08891 [Phytophthora infestans T30-4]
MDCNRSNASAAVADSLSVGRKDSETVVREMGICKMAVPGNFRPVPGSFACEYGDCRQSSSYSSNTTPNENVLAIRYICRQS